MNKPRPHWRAVLEGAVFLLGLALAVAPTEAAFQDSGWGARPEGMGGAFTAVADDSNAPLYNPAGIVQVQWNELSAMYSRLFSGLTLYAGDTTTHLDQSYVAFVAKPIPSIGSFGISWADFNTSGLYREDTVIFSYARNLGDFFPVLDSNLALGINLKYLHRSISLDQYTANDPTFANGTGKSAFTPDLGLIYKPQEGPLAGFRVGLTGQNLTQPNVGFQEVDRVPAQYRLGFAYQSAQMPWLVPALDLVRSDGNTDADAGLESWLFHDTLGLRAGVNNDEATAGISFYQDFNRKIGIRLDYSFAVPYYVQGTSGSQRLSLSVYF